MTDHPPLPPHIVGRPFGADEAGRPILEVRGPALRATVDYMLYCVGQQAAAALLADAPAAEREACITQAKAAALQQLADRLNAALPDVRDHITGDYLMNEGNNYSFEFDTFVTEYCRQLSGDAQFDFNAGAASIPPAIARLVRTFSLRQGYNLVPRFAAMFASTDLRVVETTRDSARIQWRDRMDHELPPAVHWLHTWSFCQNLQGTMASLPKVIAGQPMAEVKELRCQLRGDECCEWEFHWQNPPRGRLASALSTVRGRPKSKGAGQGSGFDEVLIAFPAPNPAAAQDLPPLPPTMQGRPFGVDENEQPIRHVRGSLVRGAILQMLDYRAHQLAQELPATMTPEEREAQIQRAREDALNQLVERLNSSLPDPAYHISADYLLDEANYYSHEFQIYVDVLASQVCGDPDFTFHRGMRSIPASLVILGRPFSVRQVYNLLPRFTARVADDDVRLVGTTPDSAIIQLHPAATLAQVPPALSRHWQRQACQAFQGAYLMVPRLLAGLPPADVIETRCMLRGDPCCEWEFRWQSQQASARPLAWAGLAVSLGLLAYGLLSRAGWPFLAWLGALLPVTAGWLAGRAEGIRRERDEAQRLVLEQREQAEAQYDSLQAAHADLQVSSIALKQKVSELTALHEIGLAVSATLDLDELLNESLRAVSTHLGFDRAILFLVDEEGHRLSGGHTSGGSPEISALVSQMGFSLDDPHSFIAQVVHSGKPVLVTDLSQVTDINAHPYLRSLGSSSFLIVPMNSQGKVVGVLGVDNTLTGRPIPSHAAELLLTAGTQIAGAVESARGYATLEERVQERTLELAEATQKAEAAQSAAQESQRRMADIIDFLPDATLVIDREGRVIAWNRAIEEMTGVKAGDILGKGNYEYALPFYGERRPILVDLVAISKEELEQKYAHIQRHGTILAGETYVPCLRGCAHYLMGTASILHDTKGNIEGAIEVIRDITERRRAEEELRQAKEAAEAATLAKSVFLATMSHEIRTPMNAVIGMTGLLLDTPLTPQQREFAETIRTSGDALLTIINDILDFSKIEAGRMELEREPFDLLECVESAVDLLAGRAAEKELNLGCVIERDVPPAIYGDMARLRQVLVNLLANAVKFTERGEVVAAVSSQVVEWSGSQVIQSSDSHTSQTGTSLAPLQRDHLTIRLQDFNLPSAIPASASPQSARAGCSTLSAR